MIKLIWQHSQKNAVMWLFFHLFQTSQRIWFAYFSAQAPLHSQSSKCWFFIASRCCLSTSHLAERETAKPASAWLCAGRISLFPPCVTLLHKGMQWGQSIHRDAFLSLSRVVVCGRLIKHWGLPVDCYWVLPIPLPPPLSLLSHSLCDITVWLGRMEKLLALEIDVAVCSWLRSHSHGRHTSLQMHLRAHTFPHAFWEMRACNSACAQTARQKYVGCGNARFFDAVLPEEASSRCCRAGPPTGAGKSVSVCLKESPVVHTMISLMAQTSPPWQY